MYALVFGESILNDAVAIVLATSVVGKGGKKRKGGKEGRGKKGGKRVEGRK